VLACHSLEPCPFPAHRAEPLAPAFEKDQAKRTRGFSERQGGLCVFVAIERLKRTGACLLDVC
jgi:hypothetical protein